MIALPEALPMRPPERRVYAKRAGRHRWRHFSDRGRYLGTLRWSANSRTGSWTAAGGEPEGIFCGKAKHAMEMGFEYAAREIGVRP